MKIQQFVLTRFNVRYESILSKHCGGSWKGGDGQSGPFPERYRLLREQMEYDKNWGYFPLPSYDPTYYPPWAR